MFFAIVAKEIIDKKLSQKITNKYRKNRKNNKSNKMLFLRFLRYLLVILWHNIFSIISFATIAKNIC